MQNFSPSVCVQTRLLNVAKSLSLRLDGIITSFASRGRVISSLNEGRDAVGWCSRSF